MRLDPRLALAFDLYEDCDLAADIGTDHAHLPTALLRAGKCRRMILTDVSESALRNAESTVARAGLSDRVELRLGDGLQVLREPCAVISVLGMGGRTIRDILLGGADRLRGASLILSAHTDLPLVREAVAAVGYHLVSETPCFDNGRHYLLLKALPGPEELSPRELRLGKPLFQSDSPDLIPYLAHRQEVLEDRLHGMLRSAERDGEEIDVLESDLRYLRQFTEQAGR